MKKFFSVNDVSDLKEFVVKAQTLKTSPFDDKSLGENKTLGLIFLNPSLRTRLSTQKAGLNLGMQVMVMNMGQEGWALETRDGVAMDGNTVEHIREAAGVIGQYCDVVGFRSFPSLKDRDEDYSETLFNKFMEFCKVPLISLESATRHPLQSFADLSSIEEHKTVKKPNVVFTWAPHVKALPQAVPNSFAGWMNRAEKEGMSDFCITHPEGYELAEEFTKDSKIIYNQEEAIKDADFVYVKNWSSYHDYGKVISTDEKWMIQADQLSKNTKGMHCLPVRRDVELASNILDGPQSLVQAEAGNRLWAAQTVLKEILSS